VYKQAKWHDDRTGLR